MVKIRGNSRALFFSLSLSPLSPLKDSAKKPGHKALIGPQKHSDKAWKIGFIEACDCAGEKALNGPHAPLLNSLVSKKKKKKSGPLFEYCPDP